MRPRRLADEVGTDRAVEDEPPPREGTSGKAIASLVLGLASFCLSLVTGIPAIILGFLALGDVKRSRGRLQGQGLAIAGIVTGGLGIALVLPLLLVGLMIPATQKMRQAAARMQAQNNLKQMALAMYNYHDTHGRFPPAALRAQGNGKPLLSWRVALLPYLEQDALYRQFNLNEPWDGPTNKPLLSRMPRVYALPLDPPDGSGLTHYQVFVGPRAAFEDPKGPRLTDFTDGTSNTFLIVEAATAVPWTKPDDLSFDPNQPLPALGGRFPGGFNAAFADGSVRLIPADTPEATLRALITRNGGEVVNPP